MKKINRGGRCWSPNLEMVVFCRPPVMQECGIRFLEPEAGELKEKFAGTVRLDLREHRIAQENIGPTGGGEGY